MRVAGENISKQGGVVVSVSLAENGLPDVRSVEGLANTFPNLKVFILGIVNPEFESSAKQYSPLE
jgi:hypothetical protein